MLNYKIDQIEHVIPLNRNVERKMIQVTKIIPDERIKRSYLNAGNNSMKLKLRELIIENEKLRRDIFKIYRKDFDLYLYTLKKNNLINELEYKGEGVVFL